ncbi:acyl-CoA carboxylase epsilon subunit [Actinokineospora sp. G85]|uniref:acyl-CoA carboxylase epsilon subunit n=1 Tax=Actinokineospora sp. G85 TaxID=3406626 RepID=UPI003C737FD5
MSPRDPLFRFEGDLDDEEIALLTALLLARLATPPVPEPEPGRPRWRRGYRSPGSWR